jgi:gluconate:H+ symporter, GntP family
MVQGPWLIVILAVSIFFIIIATSRFKVHPFIVLLLASYFVGFSSGMSGVDIAKTISQGFGGILTYIGLVIILGTIIGIFLEKSGAAIKLAEVVLKVIGKKHPALGLSIVGYIVSIPVFCDSAFVILSSLKRSLVQKTGQSAVTMSVALATGLYATHTLVPPTPGPIAAAGNLGLDNQLGLVILFGLFISIFTMFAGYFWALFVGKKLTSGEDLQSAAEDLDAASSKKLPSAWAAIAPIFAPILLICLGSIARFPTHPLGDGLVFHVFNVLGSPLNALVIGFLFATRLAPSFDLGKISEWIGDGIKASANIIIITGAGGAFGAILKATQIGDYLGQLLAGLGLGILLPFFIAAAFKTAQGSSTVALVTTSALLAPMLVGLGLESTMGRVLTVMAIGAGAMTVSHANDSFFWVVSQFSKMDVATAYKSQTLATLVQGIVTIIIVSILAMIFV